MKQVGSWVYLPALYEREVDPVLAELNLTTIEYNKGQVIINSYDISAISEGDDENQSLVYLTNGLTFRINMPYIELAEFIIHVQTTI